MNALAKILSSKIRGEIFRLLFGTSDQALHMRDIERKSGFAIGTIQGELKKLSELDLILKEKDGNRTYYRANKSHPPYSDIHNLVLKTSGRVDVLRNALDKEKIKLAFVFGSFARGEETAASDIDLMVVGSLGLRGLITMLANTQETILREINPHIHSEDEFRKKIQKNDHFVSQVVAGPKIFILGSEDELNSMAG